MQKFKRLKEQKGITLVALVITIIILLILAAISIQALTNQGLFKQAQNAKNLTEEKIAEQAKQKGVRIFPLSEYQLPHSSTDKRPPTLLMGYGCLSEKQMKDGLAALREIVEK